MQFGRVNTMSYESDQGAYEVGFRFDEESRHLRTRLSLKLPGGIHVIYDSYHFEFADVHFGAFLLMSLVSQLTGHQPHIRKVNRNYESAYYRQLPSQPSSHTLQFPDASGVIDWVNSEAHNSHGIADSLLHEVYSPGSWGPRAPGTWE